MPVDGWYDIQMAKLFDSTIPGEWGEASSPRKGVPVLRSTNFRDDGSLDYGDIAIRSIPASRLAPRRVTKGTILIEKAGGSSTRAAGRVVYCDRDLGGTASNFVEIVRVDKDFSSKFVFYLLYHSFWTGRVYKYQQQTTGIINFKLGQYLAESVAIPRSRSEQLKIAEVLSVVDEAIDDTEALIEKQRRLKTGLIQDLLSYGIDEHGTLRSEETHAFKNTQLGRLPAAWDCPSIGALADHVKSGVTPRGGQSVYSPDGVLFLRSQNVHFDGLRLDDVAYISERIHRGMLRSQVFENDVLLNITGASIGRCCRMPAIAGEANVNQHVCAIRLKEVSRPRADFLSAVLESHIGQHQIAQLNAGGNREGLNYQQVRAFVTPWPSDPDEFERITEAINGVTSSIDALTAASDKLRQLRTGLMQDLLSGDRRVTALLGEREAVTA